MGECTVPAGTVYCCINACEQNGAGGTGAEKPGTPKRGPEAYADTRSREHEERDEMTDPQMTWLTQE